MTWNRVPKHETQPTVRELLVRCRSVLLTAAADTPEDLVKPERARVIQRTISYLDAAIENWEDG